MATRLTGITRGRRVLSGRGRTVVAMLSAIRAWSRRRKAIVGAVALLAIFAACSSTNTYPIDYYTAMHYQHSFRTLEPPRFQSPDSAVPVQGAAPQYTTQQILQLENPIPADEASIARGQQLFNVNCAPCHGESGNGDGPVQPYLVQNGARSPAVLTSDTYVGVEDNFFYNRITNGLPPYMPAFANLIPGDQRWDLVNYIRTLQDAAQ